VSYNSQYGGKMKKLLITLVALLALAVPVSAAILETSKAEVVGDVRFDYQFNTNEGIDNTSLFILDRARLGATTTFDEGGGALIFQYRGGNTDLQYAYIEAYPLGNAKAKLGGIVGRQYTLFGLTKDLDKFQPLAAGPIEEKYISSNQDGVAVVGSVGKNFLGAFQYHNGAFDSTETAEKDWNAYAKFQPCKYFYISSSFLQNVEAVDFMAEVVGLEAGPVSGSFEHLSIGNGYGFDFGERLDEFSATLGVGVGQTRKVTLLGRADWLEGEQAKWYAGVNWSVKDQVFLQGNALLNPQMELVDNIVKLRAVVLFN